MIQLAIREAMEYNDLSYDTAAQSMREIMNGSATQVQIAAFLTALRMKGEGISEITACAAVLRECCTPLRHDEDVCEIVGTGGDHAGTFNVSTVSAFVIAAAGVPVAKHGNRSVSSKCGAADVLEALGAKIDLTAEQSERVLKNTGMCFMFAPLYHSSMKYAAPVRRELGVRTIFNLIGPLANPACAKIQLLGVCDKNLIEPFAAALAGLGVKRAMVVCGEDGLDEITVTAATQACEVKNGALHHCTIDPRLYGIPLCQSDELAGGDAGKNAKIARAVLGGKKDAKRDIVLLNAAACLYMAGRADRMESGVLLAAKTIDSGAAYQKMEAFMRATNEAAK